MDTSQPSQPDTAPQESSPLTNWAWPIIAGLATLAFLISWIGWTTFITIVLWIVIGTAVVGAIALALFATQAEDDDEKTGGWCFAGGSLVVALVAWFLIPSPPPVSNSAGNSNNPPLQVGTPSVKPLPPEYQTLCTHLAMEMKQSPDQFRDDKGMTEIIAEGHSAVLALRGIQSSDSEIAYVAAQGQAAFTEAVARLERINALPKPPSEGEVLVQSFFAGLLTGDPISGAFAGGAIGADAEQKRNAVAVEAQALLAAVEKADAAHMMLPTIAKKYAATPTTASGRIIVDIDESWGGFGPNDWVSLYNNGPAIDDCTIQVQLSGLAGGNRTNVHFLRNWPANTWVYARYEPGQEILGRQAGRMTVTEIQKADISIWSPAFTTSTGYVYQGSEKDNDIAAHCKKFSFTGRYQPFEKGIVWNTQRGCYFTLNGFPYAPKCRADVFFKKGTQSKGWYWEFDYWKDGEEKYFGTNAGQLTFDPDAIDLTLSFPNSSYKHTVTLKVKN